MFSLVITIVAIALVALLALATIFYGLPAMDAAGAKSRAAAIISQSTQVLGAAELYNVEQRGWSQSVQDLIDKEYLKDDVSFQGIAADSTTPWTQPMPGVPTYWVLRATDEAACKLVNLQARGDNGIYNKARPGLVTQCFGTSAPFTTVTTRQGLDSQGLGLDVVFSFADEPGLEFDILGGGWSVEPTQTLASGGNGGNGGGSGGVDESLPADTGSADGNFLDGDLRVSTPGQYGVATNVVDMGALPSGVAGVQEIVITNSGSSTMTLGTPTTTGPFSIYGSSCPSELAAGSSCTISVQAGPFTGYGSSQEVKGSLVIPINGKLVTIGLKGSVIVQNSGSGQEEPTPPVVPVRMQTPQGDSLANGLIFPDTPVGHTSYKWLQVQNVGDHMTYGSPARSVTGPYSIASTDCGATQNTSEWCSIKLGFTPTIKAQQDGQLLLFANGASAGLRLTGRGVDLPVHKLGMTVSHSSLDLGFVGVGQVSGNNITFKNTGTSALSLTQVPFIEGDGFSVFSTTCTGTLEAGASCIVQVRFIPDEIKSYKSALNIEWGNIDPFSVELTGVGTNPLTVVSISLPTGIKGRPYSSGDLRTAWRFGGSSVTEGLELSPLNGIKLNRGLVFEKGDVQVTGTPTETGNSSFSLTGRYASKYLANQTFSLLVEDFSIPEVSSIFSAPADGLCYTSKADEKLYCIGFNQSRALVPHSTSATISAPTALSTVLNVTARTKRSLTTCVISNGGLVYCWGANDYGQAGGATVNSTPVTTPTRVGGTGIVDIATSQLSACTVNSQGVIACWGYRYTLEGGTASSYTRTPYTPAVFSGVRARQIDSSVSALCAVTTDGRIACTHQMLPKASGSSTYAAGFSNIDHIMMGSYFLCAQKTTGGQICRGSYVGVYHSQIVTLPNAPAFMDLISHASGQVCGINRRGEREVHCWQVEQTTTVFDITYLGITKFDNVDSANRKKLISTGKGLCLETFDGKISCQGLSSYLWKGASSKDFYL